MSENTNKSLRLDSFLVSTGKVDSRNKVISLIKQKKVLVNDVVIEKPSHILDLTDKVEIIKNDEYVSRGAYKLIEAIKTFKLNLKDKVCLDIGSSTGGFSQVMLENGAKIIYAVDVGTNQFDKKLLSNKIMLMENTHFLSLNENSFQHKINFIACDVSFISATKIIEHVCKIIKNNFTFVCLIKPQFELTKQIMDKNKGKVVNKIHHDMAIKKIVDTAKTFNLDFSKVIESPILGAKKENKEFLICLYKGKHE